MIVPDLLEKPIVLIDIGAVGNPPSHWLPLKDKIHLIGFEPNKDECRKLNESGCGYKKSEFLPYALGACDEKRPFYITEYHECCSLLKPNFEWLQRFDYGSFFNLNRTIEVETLSLDSIEKLSEIRVDALKIDAQGNELPILQGAESMLENVFLIEVESGLHKNYENETTFDELSPYLTQKGFTCMELFTQPAQKRKTRQNIGNRQKDNPWPAKASGYEISLNVKTSFCILLKSPISYQFYHFAGYSDTATMPLN